MAGNLAVVTAAGDANHVVAELTAPGGDSGVSRLSLASEAGDATTTAADVLLDIAEAFASGSS